MQEGGARFHLAPVAMDAVQQQNAALASALACFLRRDERGGDALAGTAVQRQGLGAERDVERHRPRLDPDEGGTQHPECTCAKQDQDKKGSQQRYAHRVDSG